MTSCSQAAEGMAAIIDHAENYLMEKPMTDEEFADQVRRNDWLRSTHSCTS